MLNNIPYVYPDTISPLEIITEATFPTVRNNHLIDYYFGINNRCKCGAEPNLIWHYIKGAANHVNYFCKCSNCKTRTRNRKNAKGAASDWKSRIFLT